MRPVYKLWVWCALLAVITVPIVAAAMSPQLAWRGPVYISAGFAGIAAMALLLLQPLLAGKYLPGVSASLARRAHRTIGSLLILAIVVHVAGLWITSPPDVIDALLFRSPTAFSAWGVVAMGTLFAAGLLAALKRWLALKPRVWRFIHLSLATITVLGSVVHAVQIEGTMETVSKILLCVLLLAVTGKLIFDQRLWRIHK